MAKAAKKLEIIGVSGVRGSFSEEAARTYAAKSRLKTYKLEYLVTVENVLAALERGDVSLAIFPVANNTIGVVLEAMHAVAKYRFSIVKTFAIDIHQNLLAKKGVTMSAVKRVVSQLPALEQCRVYLKTLPKRISVEEYADTAKAAQDLSTGELSATTAVVASRAAAKLYGLQVLVPKIQDLKHNKTYFIAARRTK